MGRPTVSNWRWRFAREVLEAANDKRPAFPEPVAGTDGKPLFDAEEIARWLDLRPLPDADTEKDGAPLTHGERFRQEPKVRRLVALRHETHSVDRLIAMVLAVLAMDAEGEAWVPECLPPTLLPDRAAASPRVQAVARELAEVRGGQGAAADEVLNPAGRLESDLAMKEQARDRIMARVLRLLRKHGYPPDKQPAAIERVLKQAEDLAEAMA